MGFSLISADERIPEVLCYSEYGTISDTLYDKSLKFCIELVEQYVEAQTSEDLDIDALTLSAAGKISKNIKAIQNGDPSDIDTSIAEWTEEAYVEKLKSVPNGWHQGHPYNELLPFVVDMPSGYGGRAAVGCAMIAVSQIMTYHKKSFNNYISTAMWPSMITNHLTSPYLKSLMSDLFYDLKISYDNTGTESNSTKVRAFLNNNGYTAGAMSTYSFAGVWTALNDGPTYIEGHWYNGTIKKEVMRG